VPEGGERVSDPTPETLFLASAMQATAADVLAVADLIADDLIDPGSRDILAVLVDLARAGRPHHHDAVIDELVRRGGPASGRHAKMRFLDACTSLHERAANPLALRHLAAGVVAAAYRHRIAELGHALVEAADTMAEDDLLPMLRHAGTDAVAHAERLSRLRGEVAA